MKLRSILLFVVTVLVPTMLLSYFSLLAVRGEKEILETNMREKYQSIAGIVLGDIETSLQRIPESLQRDPQVIEPLLFKNTFLFQDEVMIFDRAGRAVDKVRQRAEFGDPVYVAPVGRLPYEIAVYERYPVISKEFENVKQRVSQHFGIVGLSALAILVGGLFTLGELFREWRKTELKGSLIASLAHDLRGPLTSIRMFAEMLQTDRVPSEEKRREYYRIISAESGKLTQLAQNVLDFSRIERRHKKLEKKLERLPDLVTSAVSRFETYQTKQSHSIVLEIDRTLPEIPLNAEAIGQAVINLLSNAAKYSPPGSVILVSLFRRKGRIILSVRDQGIGISPLEKRKIFREYYRSIGGEVQAHEGSGLGLALVRYAALAHRGSIRVKSKEGKGSEFLLELPIS